MTVHVLYFNKCFGLVRLLFDITLTRIYINRAFMHIKQKLPLARAEWERPDITYSHRQKQSVR